MHYSARAERQLDDVPLRGSPQPRREFFEGEEVEPAEAGSARFSRQRCAKSNSYVSAAGAHVPEPEVPLLCMVL